MYLVHNQAQSLSVTVPDLSMFLQCAFCNLWVTLNGPAMQTESLAVALTSAMFGDRLTAEVNF